MKTFRLPLMPEGCSIVICNDGTEPIAVYPHEAAMCATKLGAGDMLDVAFESEDQWDALFIAGELLPPAIHEPILKYFAYGHLPGHLQPVSRPFARLAKFVMSLPRNPERTVALRKLLEAKDAAVRARLD